MDYKNEKLNIEIIDNVFEIKEHKNFIGLEFNKKLMCFILPNSKILSVVLGSGDVSIETYNNSRIIAYDDSSVVAHQNSVVEAYGKSTVKALDHAKVEAYGNSIIEAHDSAIVTAKGNSSVFASDYSEVTASYYSTVALYRNSRAEIRGCTKAFLHDEAVIDAYGFSTIYVRTKYPQIHTHNYFGAIIGQVFKVTKPIKVYKQLEDGLIATLELSKGQIFQSEEHDKCRTDRALVVAIESKDKSKSYKKGVSHYDSKFVYEVGKEVIADEYDNNICECSNGIHFFLNRKSAEEY